MYMKISVNIKMLPKKVVVSPEDSITMPQLGGPTHKGAVYTGPEGTPGNMSAEGKKQKTQPRCQRYNRGTFS